MNLPCTYKTDEQIIKRTGWLIGVQQNSTQQTWHAVVLDEKGYVHVVPVNAVKVDTEGLPNPYRKKS